MDLPSFVKYFPSIDTLPSATSELSPSTRSTYQGIAVASYNLGCFCGAVFTIFVGNTLGRKRTIFYGSIIMTIGALLQCTSYDLPQWIVGRLVTGWGNGMNTSTVPMWQSGMWQPSHLHSHLLLNYNSRDGKVTPAWKACHDRRHVDHRWYHHQLLD